MTSKEDAILSSLQDLHKRLDRLEKAIESNKKTVHLEIERIETLNLEKMIYQLDTIDIKELSGSLNIGNTFEQKPEPIGTNRIKSPKDTASVHPKEDILIKINGKEIPYFLEGEKSIEPSTNTVPPPTDFTFRDIHIGTIEDASAVNFGNNFPTNFRSNKKHNQGLGNIIGNNNDIHDLKSYMKEKNAREIYNENQDDQQPAWVDALEKKENGFDQESDDSYESNE
ncbi:hypothetical protein FZC84_00590 [Rossellomorea vietnamensis]|uniref:Uncharacterized protein n=1 Tax=Rossellomorea vietnamensis TaxID=218284 RepID=A0A5D4MJL9_9BACI|nr:hypothetical protein [Rossellomorea vietnamensis]TYS01201.1 hypothetical protein FZC84_00590 [Rossellomorea vietnamensis]